MLSSKCITAGYQHNYVSTFVAVLGLILITASSCYELERQEVSQQKKEQQLHIQQNEQSQKFQYDMLDHDYDNDPFFQNILVNGTQSTSIYHYIKASQPLPYALTTLYWDNDGKFSRNSSIIYRKFKWYENLKIHEHNIDVPQHGNYYGTAALLLTTDFTCQIIGAQNETDIRQPPVPILAYTIPSKYMNHSSYRVIPNPYDLGDWNRRTIKNRTSASSYQEGINKIVWRGEIHGNSDLNRLIILDMGQDVSNNHWLDANETNMEFEDMAKYKYQIDIGGVSGTSWTGLRWKMCSGHLVFKVDTYSVDWWHHTIEPWIHYIPVYYNLSNLYDQYQWAESHPEEAYEIVQRGKAKCMETASKKAAVQALNEVVRSLSLLPQSKDTIREANAIINGWGSFYQPILDQKAKDLAEELAKKEEEIAHREEISAAEQNLLRPSVILEDEDSG